MTATAPDTPDLSIAAATGRRLAGKGSRVPGSGVVAAVERDIAEIARRSPELAESGLAATALALAAAVDDTHNSATSRSMCARELREHLDRLRELAPPLEEVDRIDELRARRTVALARDVAS